MFIIKPLTTTITVVQLYHLRYDYQSQKLIIFHKAKMLAAKTYCPISVTSMENC